MSAHDGHTIDVGPVTVGRPRGPGSSPGDVGAASNRPVVRDTGVGFLQAQLLDRWPLVYIAGPYTLPDPVTNVRRAVEVAEHIEGHECAVFVPHLSMLWDLISPAPVDDWYARDLRVLDHCDALVRFAGDSFGADREVVYADQLGIPTFDMVFDDRASVAFYEWRQSHRSREVFDQLRTGVPS